MADAEVYKYVDEEGNTIFSDKPPKTAEMPSEVVEIDRKKVSPGIELPSVAGLAPIRNSSDSSKSVMLEKVKIDFQGGDEDEVGKLYKYTRDGSERARQLRSNSKPPKYPFGCLGAGKLTLGNARYIISESDLGELFNEVFEENGYQVAGRKTFAMEQSTANDLSLAAIITDVRLEHCGLRSASDLRNFTQNSTYLRIDWAVFDNLERKVVYETTTEGGEYSFKKPARYEGAAVSASLAFRQATENLLADPAFVALLQASKSAVSGYQGQGTIADLRVTSGQPNGKFVTRTPAIEKAAVTIRTAGGHGSGFVISKPGYILTNHHVVGDHGEVLVIFGDRQQHASVVRSHPGRDVALLKLEKPSASVPLQINVGKVNLGEEIYVVGTPLDERLSFSISRGIISARRTLDQRSYYQTDAAVNPGNSGGPVFDEAGNVIGITVAGLFTSDGASKNINYIIPIMDALEALDIEVN